MRIRSSFWSCFHLLEKNVEWSQKESLIPNKSVAVRSTAVGVERGLSRLGAVSRGDLF